MRVAVINTGGYDQVLRRSFNTREWEEYRQNAHDIGQALRELSYDVFNFTDGKDIMCLLEEHKIEVAWVCSGGIQGRNSAAHLPGILEMLGVPYVGSPPLAAAIADHKPTAKKIVAFAGQPTPAFQVFHTPDDELDERLRFPLFVKPASGLCSCGVYHVDSEQDLRSCVDEVTNRYQSEVLVEEYISGRDLTVPILGKGDPVALPIIERHFYAPDDPVGKVEGAVLPHPQSTLAETSSLSVSLSAEVSQTLANLAVAIFKNLGLRHFARLDFRLDDTGAVYFLEANHKPDLTRDSVFAQSAMKIGIEYDELIGSLLRLALAEPQARG